MEKVNELDEKSFFAKSLSNLLDDSVVCNKKECGKKNPALNLICSHCGKLIFGNEIVNSIIFTIVFLAIPTYLAMTMMLWKIGWLLHVFIAAISTLFFILFFRNVISLVIHSLIWVVPFYLVDILSSYTTETIAFFSLNIFQVALLFFVVFQFLRWLVKFYRTQEEHKFLTTTIVASILISIFFLSFSLLEKYLRTNYADSPEFYFIFKLASYSHIYFQIRVVAAIIAIAGLIIHALLKYNRIGLIRAEKFKDIHAIDNINVANANNLEGKKAFIKIITLIYLNFAKIVERGYNLLVLTLNQVYSIAVTFYKNFVNLMEQLWFEIKHYVRTLLSLVKTFIVYFLFPLVLVVLLVLSSHLLANLLPEYLMESSFWGFAKIVILAIIGIRCIEYLAAAFFKDFKADIEYRFNLKGKKPPHEIIEQQKDGEKGWLMLDKENPDSFEADYLEKHFREITTGVIIQKIYDFLAKIVPTLLFFFFIVIPIIVSLLQRSFIPELNFRPSYFSLLGIILVVFSAFTIYRRYKQATKPRQT